MDSYMPLKQLPIAQYTPRKNNGYSPKDFLNCLDAIDFLEVEELKWESPRFASCQRRRFRNTNIKKIGGLHRWEGVTRPS